MWLGKSRRIILPVILAATLRMLANGRDDLLAQFHRLRLAVAGAGQDSAEKPDALLRAIRAISMINGG